MPAKKQIVIEPTFTNAQKEFLIKELERHWDKYGGSMEWEGIKMAKRIVRSLKETKI